uniref:Zinc finger CCHC domain-containing protein 7 n=1 Tax=Seriola dumerili TaxID=41447 RepID=A0A3B4VJI6_SERDU
MYCTYQDREELEDDLYHEDDRDSEGSEANSELEFRLYSQLHYSSNAGEMEEQEGTGEKAEGQDSRQPEVTEKTADANGELEHTGESGPPSPNISNSSESDSEESESRSESELDSSDSSDSSDSPDSDCLENWMILGRGNQEGDQSISLNLEGGSDSNTGVSRVYAQIYNKDKGARIVVPRVSNRYYTGKNVQCRNCNKTGHLSKTCPEPKKLLPCFLCGTPGHVVSECPNKHCNNCGLPGHLFGSCSERAYWHKQCHRCSMTGHFFDVSSLQHPTKTGPPVKQHRQDNGRSPAYCYNCSRKGHFGHACTRQKMFNGVFASIPFINHYDTVEDIKRRQHRLKLKVKGRSHTDTNICSESTGSVKPWKAKRPVPTSRGPLPTPKLIFDEADDFPRGGGKGEKLEKKRKKNRMKKTMELPPEGHRGSRSHRPCWTTRKRRNRDRRTADKKLSAPMYPTDENLFIIKQRKRNR